MKFVGGLLEEGVVDANGANMLTEAGVDGYPALLELFATYPSISAQNLNVAVLSSMALNKVSQGVASAFAASATMVPPVRAHGARDPSRTRKHVTVPRRATTSKISFGKKAKVDCRNSGCTWPIRDQGARGTCVAFAVVSILEHHHGPKKGPLDLAEQYLYWAAKESPRDHSSKDDGTTLRCAMDALTTRGVCAETHWPYDPKFDKKSVTHARAGVPSDPAHHDASQRMVSTKMQYEASLRNNADVLYGLIAKGTPAAITLPVFKDKLTARRHNWNNQFAETSGRIFDPPPGAVATLGHAVCVVAFVPDSAAKGGGWFVFRNSWGTAWGHDTSTGPARSPGYGYVSAAYVHDHAWELLAV